MNDILLIFDLVNVFHLVKSERRPQTRPWFMQTQEDAVISMSMVVTYYLYD